MKRMLYRTYYQSIKNYRRIIKNKRTNQNSPSMTTRGMFETIEDKSMNSFPNLLYLCIIKNEKEGEKEDWKGNDKREVKEKERKQGGYAFFFAGFQQHLMPSYFSPNHLNCFKISISFSSPLPLSSPHLTSPHIPSPPTPLSSPSPQK